MEVVEGRIVDTFHKNGWHRLKLEDGSTVVGFAQTTPIEGMLCQFIGEWAVDPKWGKQFKFSTYVSMDVTMTPDAVIRWLSLFSGVGPKKAQDIFDFFGKDAYSIIRNDPDQLLKVKGVSPVIVEKIKEDFQDQRSIWALYAKLGEHNLLYQGTPFTELLIRKIHQKFGEDSLNVILYKPYRLTRIGGVGFQIADTIARKAAGYTPDSEDRIVGSIFHAMSLSQDAGNACFAFDDVIKEAGDALYHGDETVPLTKYDALVGEALHDLIRKGHLIRLENQVYTKSMWETETYIVDRLKQYSETKPTMSVSASIEAADKASEEMNALIGIPLDEVQRRAVAETLRNSVSVITGYPGTGKCFAAGTEILMFDGSIRKIEDIQEGDQVMGWDSTPRTVTGLDAGIAPLWRVTPRKGSPFTVTGNHILPLKLKNGGKEKTLLATVEEHNRLPEGCMKERRKLYRCGVEFPEQTTTIEPYFLGVWLGDGSWDTQRITSADPEVVSYLQEYAEKLGLRLTSVDDDATSPMYSIVGTMGKPNYLLNQLRSLGIIPNKHIPLSYLRNSRESRLELLAGIIDTDGYLTCGTYDLITKYPRLASDILYLCRSLGLAAYSSECQKGFTRDDGTKFVGSYHRISISGDIDQIPCKVARRKAPPRKQVKDVLRTGFSLEELGEGQYYGFETDGDHIFLLGDFTATHNTTLIRAVTIASSMQGLRIELCAPSGKASRRLSEATGMEGKTIHRLLGAKPPIHDGADSSGYDYDERTPLPADIIICDETTMADLKIFEALLRAMRPDTKLLLVGDIDQLPSVGPCALFRDIIESKRFPVTRLTKVYRQKEGSAVGLACEAVKNGLIPEWEKLSIESINEDELRFTTVADADALPKELIHQAVSLIEAGVPQDEIQIVVPQKKGRAGAPVISFYFQQHMGRYRWKNHKWEFVGPCIQVGTRQVPKDLQYPSNWDQFEDTDLRKRVPKEIYVAPGDRVIHCANNYELEVFNGDVGIVEQVDVELGVLSVKYPFRETPVVYPSKWIHQLDLAYALTCHRCVSSNTRVVTENGMQQIGDLESTGMVLTSQGMKPRKELVRNPPSTLLRIVTKDGYDISVTPDHRLSAWDGNSYQLLRADQLTSGQFLRLKLGWEDIQSSPEIPICTSTFDVRTVIYNLPTVMSEDLALLLGLSVADGTFFHTGFRIVKRHRDVSDKAAAIVRSLFGYEAKVTPVDNQFNMEVSSVQLSSWLTSFGGLDPNKKRIPVAILKSSRQYQAQFLRGLFEDGTVNVKHGGCDHIELSNVSYDLIRDVQTMLLGFGIISSVRTRHLKNPDRTAYLLYIYGREITKFREHIGFISKFKNDRLLLPTISTSSKYVIPIEKSRLGQATSYERNGRHRGVVSRTGCEVLGFNDDLEYHHDRIVSIEEVVSPTCCFEVPDTGTFLQNGFEGSNCQGSEYQGVVFGIHNTYWIMLQRNLLYTAISRAKSMLRVCGTRQAVRQAVKTQESKTRQTLLAKRLSPEVDAGMEI